VLHCDELVVNKHKFTWGSRTYVMGILNITPDSFSGDGLITAPEREQNLGEGERYIGAAEKQARDFVAAGVDILDVGGESTRPGSSPITIKEELSRILPVIKVLVEEFDVLVSVDTYKNQVAQAALEAGAKMVNDVWGLHADPAMAETIAHYKVPAILMHNRSSWVHTEIKERLGGRYVGVPYEELLEDIKRELMESVDLARQAGIPDEHIILDPGIGFGKTVEQNMEIIDRLMEIRSLGYPILLGPSRKSFIGYTLDLPAEQRLEGTSAAVAVGIVRGADIVRVHDVEFMQRVIRMTDAIVRREKSN
jgi:dihydropteroate synthase